ncbi:hypothetical protein N431DRAFT_487934 [Stipitochalara longipes BDJ]|nr:hypothetical protein N431DRAFT_487934 [Stipitochalara longipes BDJ]
MYTQEETEAYLKKFFDDWHAFDTSRFANHFTKDIVFKAANEPEINGLEALQQHFGAIFPLLISENHKHLQIDAVRDGTCIYNAFEVSFVFKSHPEDVVAFPALAYFVRVPHGEAEAGKIKKMTVYQDLGLLKAKIVGA